MKAAIEASSSRFWLISNNKNHMYCEYVTKKKKKSLCQKHLLLYQYSIHSLDLLASINQDVFCAILQLKSHHRFFPTLIFFFCVHVQRYQMLHCSSWESLALPSHCEPHNLQCDVKIIPALNLVVVVTGYKP